MAVVCVGMCFLSAHVGSGQIDTDISICFITQHRTGEKVAYHWFIYSGCVIHHSYSLFNSASWFVRVCVRRARNDNNLRGIAHRASHFCIGQIHLPLSLTIYLRHSYVTIYAPQPQPQTEQENRNATRTWAYYSVSIIHMHVRNSSNDSAKTESNWTKMTTSSYYFSDKEDVMKLD